MRTATSITIEDSVLTTVKRTRGKASVSERVNQLLKKGLQVERYEQLEQEAARFFASPRSAERAQAKAFQKASLRSLARD